MGDGDNGFVVRCCESCGQAVGEGDFVQQEFACGRFGYGKRIDAHIFAAHLCPHTNDIDFVGRDDGEFILSEETGNCGILFAFFFSYFG